MGVTWDLSKKAANRRKHRVDFEEAATVFVDPPSAAFPDPDHSHGEQRFITIGLSARNRVLVVAHADPEDAIRIISTRRATPRERRFYEAE